MKRVPWYEPATGHVDAKCAADRHMIVCRFDPDKDILRRAGSPARQQGAGTLMGWYPIKTAPKDGTPIRVRAMRYGLGQRIGRGELPWRLRFEKRRRRYTTTNAPVHPWHKPLEWTFDPRTDGEEHWAEDEIRRARGSELLPSQYPMGRLGPPHGVRAAKASLT